MAKYCRYCGKKEKDPRDGFCYACRRAGAPVDYFYRFAKKSALGEKEQDLVRGYGKGITAGALILCALPAAALIISAALAGTGRGASLPVVIAVTALLAALLCAAAAGIGLMRLDARTVNRGWKLAAIMFIVGLTRSRRGGAAIVSAAVTAPRKIARERELKQALIRLAEDGAAEADAESVSVAGAWKCGFCGYENPSERMECRSCGKVK